MHFACAVSSEFTDEWSSQRYTVVIVATCSAIPLISLEYYTPRPPTLLTCFSINNLSGEPQIAFWLDIALHCETSGENVAMEKPRETACSIQWYTSLFVGRDYAAIEKPNATFHVKNKRARLSVRRKNIYVSLGFSVTVYVIESINWWYELPLSLLERTISRCDLCQMWFQFNNNNGYGAYECRLCSRLLTSIVADFSSPWCRKGKLCVNASWSRARSRDRHCGDSRVIWPRRVQETTLAFIPVYATVFFD